MYTQKINFISQSQHLQDAHLDAVGYLQWSLAFQLGETQVQHWNSLKVKFPPKFLSPCGSIKTLPFSEIFGFPKKKIHGGGKMWNILGPYHADISCRVRYTLAFSPKALLQLRRRPTAWMAVKEVLPCHIDHSDQNFMIPTSPLLLLFKCI